MDYKDIEIEGMKEILKDKEEYIKKLEEENKSLKEELENRIVELERIVRELIQWKEDRQIIQLDKNGKEIGFAIHNYHIEEAKEED